LHLESNRFQFFLLGAFLLGVYCFVFGQSGVLERMRFVKEKEMLAREISHLEKENIRAEALRVRYARGEFTLEECENAGFVLSGSRRLFFTDRNPVRKTATTSELKADGGGLSIDKMRIGWIIFSAAAVLIFAFIRRRQLASAVAETRQMGVLDED
jgi:hypothetical protein